MVMMIVVMVMMMTAVMVMTMMGLSEYGEDNGGSPSSPDQKWKVEEEDCERFSELPVNRGDVLHIKDIFSSMICIRIYLNDFCLSKTTYVNPVRPN